MKKTPAALFVLITLFFLSCKSENNFIYSDPTNIQDYVYEITFDEYDWSRMIEIGQDYKKFPKKLLGYGCSSFRKGNYHGRNYDMYYSNAAEYIIHVPAKNGRYASVGVSDVMPTTVPVFLFKGHKGETQNIPFLTVDGINECGVTANINIVPNDLSNLKESNPGAEIIYDFAVIRYILDNASSVDNAIELLQSHNIVGTQIWNFHYLVSDKDKTVVIEFIDDKMVVTENYIMTNYFVCLDYYTPSAQGIERYDIIKERYDSLNTKADCRTLLKDLYLSQIYDLNCYPRWYSDFFGETYKKKNVVLTPETPQDILEEYYVDVAKSTKWKRNWTDWFTKHSCLYDIDAKTLSVIFQEGKESEQEYLFTVN